ncbi:MAG: cadherin domain-containing protein [Gammaproteobacteria bacterium]
MQIRKKLLSLISLLVLVSCGGGGGGGGDSTPTPPPSPPASVNLSADPLSVLLGDETTLTWSTANASSCSASGAWSGSRSTSGSEGVAIQAVGDNQFTLTCSGPGGSGSDSVSVEGYENITGVSVDGYLTSASVFYDLNENFILDSNEESSTSNDSGGFALRKNDSLLVSLGGIDSDTQKDFEDLLLVNRSDASLDFKSITPITSVASFMSSPADIYSILNIQDSIDIYSYDPVINKNNDFASSLVFEKGNQLTILAYSIQSIVNAQLATEDTTQDYFSYIAQELESQFLQTNEAVNIEDESFILQVIEKSLQEKSVELTETIKNNMAKALSSVITLIQVREIQAADIGLFNFATSTLINDLISIADGSAGADLIENYDTESVSEYVATTEGLPQEDLTPEIKATNDFVSIDEDTSITLNILANDSLVAGVAVDIVVEGSDDGFVSNNNGNVTFVPSQDFNGTATFGYSISQSIYGGLTSDALIFIEVRPINDAPQITTPSSLDVNENETFVVTLQADDVEGDEIAFTKNGDDADEFNLGTDSGDLEFIEAPDFEERGTYNVITIASDGSDSSEKNIAINIIDLDDTAPVINPPLEFIAEENQLSIGQITATDVDTEDVEIVYSISGSEIVISSDTGVLTFQEAPDFEVKNDYSASVTATDGANSSTEEILVQIENINDNAPVFTSSEIFAVDENQLMIGTVDAEDADGDNLSFSVNSSEISINSDSGELTFLEEPDYETKSSYVAAVSVSDSVFSATQDIEINLINLNDNSPVFNSDTTFTVNENETAIGTASATDADGDTLTYSISGSEISIDSATGVMSFVAAPDYETKPSYSATVTASDGANSEQQEISININNLNDNEPIFESSLTFTANENQTAIGTASATDADGDTLTYSISGSEISIDSATGVMSFVAAPDYETKTAYQATVTASDGAFASSKQVSIEVINLNDNAPILTSANTFIVDENEKAIGTASATDADGDTLTYSISGSEISIDSATGVMSFVAAPDYETKTAYQATLVVRDGAFTVTEELLITINDLNDNNPVFNTSANFLVPEEETLIGTIQATDADANTQIVYSTDSDLITVDNTSGELNFLIQTDYESVTQYAFNISASDGENITTEVITVNIDNVNDNAPEIISSATFRSDENQTIIGKVEASDADGDSLAYSVTSSDITIDSDGVLTFITPPDYETQTAYNATVGVTDGLFSATQQIVVNIGNLEDNAPVYTGVNEFFVDENKTAIGTVTATDADGSDLSFSISNPDISINNATGIMTFVSAPDYEQQTEYSETIQITDGTLTTNADINIFINNLNDNTPELTSGTAYSVDENQTAIGTVTATDADGDVITFSISGAEINIDSSTGVLTFVEAPDYETKSSYSATLTLSDGENDRTVNITVAVNDLNDNAPVFTSDANFSVDENQIAIGTVTASDIENDTIAYSVSGLEIEINSSTGVLTFVSPPDYETKTSYSAEVTASDGTNSTTQELNISINNINDNEPVITSSSAFSADENTQLAVGFITATDADGDSLNYGIDNNIGDGTEINVNATTGEITFASTPDYETKSSYSGTVRVYEVDGGNLTTQDITITINNLDDESPVFSSSNSFAADENQTAIGTVTATDIDSDSITFSISGSEINIDSSTGVLTFVEVPDYETKSSYSATVTATDGTNATTQDITVAINDLNDNTPELTSGTAYSADENQTAIGTVTATDADGDVITFSISGAEINIDSSTGVLTFVEAPDYETKSSYSATVTATDGTNATTQDITVAVNNLSDNAPVFTSDASFSLPENQTAIGAVTATDADGDDLQFRVLSSDDDNISITSNGQLNFINAPDYETKNSYTGVIEAYDSNDSTAQNITIEITNVTEESNPPVFSNFDFPDGKTVTFADSDFEARVRVTDETGVDLSKLPIPRFIKVEGNTSVDANGAWTLNEGTIKDGIYQVVFNFPQGLPSGDYFLATFDFVDLEGNADKAYSNIVDNKVISVLGAEGNAPYFADFQISPTSVDVTQDDASVTVVVRAVDDSGIDQTLLPKPRLTTTSGVNFSANAAWENISVDGNDEYRAIFTVPQAQPSGSYYVETLFFTDIFGNSAQGFSTTENIYLEIIGAEGNAPVLKDPAISPSSVNVIYEAQNVTLSITATDDTGIDIDNLPVPRLTLSGSTFINGSQWSLSSGTSTNGTYTAVATIPQGQPSGDYYMYTGAYFYDIYGNKADLSSNLSPYNTTLLVENKSVPVFTSGATFTADENQTAIGTVTATDADGGTITYSISGSEITVNSSTGVLAFASAPDYETKSTYTATVTASDGNTPVTQDITINVNNLNDNTPGFTSGATFSAAENQTAIGTVTATDADGDTITYSISGSEITINSSTGVLTFASAPDYETKSTYTATVTATDGTNSTTQDITVNVTDVNDDAPVFTSSATFSAAENQTTIGTVTATDADGDTITYSISGSEITINSSTGVLTFASAPDYETKATYTATVTASDGTNSTTQDITVNVTDVNDNFPVFTSSATFSAAENQTAIGTVTATDADGDTITYSISGSEININSSTGVLTFASAPDYETKSTYTATVTASDGTNSTTQDITVNVTDVNDDAPVFTSSATFSAAENQTTIGTVTATDADGDTITYSISGSEITINSSTGVLTFASAPDYETKATYTLPL